MEKTWLQRYDRACDELKAAETLHRDAERKMSTALDRLDKARREVVRIYQERAQQVNA